MKNEGIGHPNIALIKYWGKKSENNLLPETSSISVLLKDFFTKTIIEKSYKDELILNGELINGKIFKKTFEYLDLLRNKDDRFIIKTVNNFPTEAGLSSSSSGITALTIATNNYYDNKYNLKQLLNITKYGSGSSIRSYTKNYTIWKNNGNLYTINSKIKLYMFAIIVNDGKKKISSREAMKISKETSTIFNKWKYESNIDFKKAIFALRTNNFFKLKKVVEKNFKLMHKTLKYSELKYTYISEKSQKILEKLDRISIKNKLIYTMDAGENVKVFCLYKDKDEIRIILNKYFKEYKLIESHIYD